MKQPQRNEICPCGSGRKYKKCHGVADESKAEQQRGVMRFAPKPFVHHLSTGAAPRPCGDCTKCCDGWVRTRVLGNDIDLNRPCPYSSGHHCTIHERRPDDPCRVFFCGWAEAGSELPEWMQPNRCGVIVLAGRSTWASRPVDVLVSAGKDPDQRLLAWYQEYSIRTMRPFLYQQNGQWYGFGPQPFQREVAARAARGDRLFL